MRVTHALERAAIVAANRPATIDADRRRNWAEVRDRVARFAGGLQQLGVQPGDRVAILAMNCDCFFEAYFAIPWAGGVMVPLNTRLAQPELAFQLEDAGVDILLYGQEFAEVAGALRGQGSVRTLIGMDGNGAPADHGMDAIILASDAIPAAQQSDADLAGIFYTGGTTGLPKGVMLSHGNLYAMAVNLLMMIQFDEDCVNFHSAPMFHLADIGILFATMAAGTHVFRRSFDADDVLESISEHKVTHCFTVPVMIERLAKHPELERFDIGSLRMLGYGGSSMPAASLDFARSRFPGVDFIQGFGQTEMAAATMLGPKAHRVDADPAKLRSAGHVCLGYEIRIVDEAGREVPRGTVGEIVGRGDNVMMGYWNRPEETADVMRDGWLHTRDAGFMDEDGYIYITDRLKDMIVSGAENVYSIEVENAISHHPAVAESAVIGVPDALWGERVHAVIVLKPGEGEIDIAGLQAFCKQRIASYKCPKSMELRADPLPRSPAGKILKGPLRDAYVARVSAD
ncbi:long-chain fatty acid--CoA ligase [Sphingobium sp. EM0848]|uniref:acyl-CoA synthetase n=1 Tax=Sphingobium sp. EM0848 TaxID=2743473 RepID=UPI00159CB4AE|nr:long-chain fatty acid--CoA ligase [Sphingobium sp. EM0848]